MAWVAGADVITGDLITAAQWNNYMGAAGSLEYLKTEADKLDDISGSAPANVLDTNYQNTTCYMRLVIVSIIGDGGDKATLKIGAGSPAATSVCSVELGNAAEDTGILIAMVPYGYYYQVDKIVGTPTKSLWYEFDLH